MVRFTKITGESGTTPHRHRKERGQSLVEFALVLPIFLVIVMGIIDFGMGLKSWISITNAAREAARFGAVHCSSGEATTAQVKDRAVKTATGLGLTAGNVDVQNCATNTSTQSLIVAIDYEYKLITPLGGLMSLLGGGMSSSIKLNSTADMRIE